MFKNHEFKIVKDAKLADILVINTCGFIDSAKEEAINTILEMAEYKKKRCKYLIVMGCLVQRYKEELQKALPEVDLFIKLEEYDKLWEKIEKYLNTKMEEKMPETKSITNPKFSRIYAKSNNNWKKLCIFENR